MAELAWPGLPKDGTKGGDCGRQVVVWDGGPEKGVLTLGRRLRSLDAGVRPNLRVGRRMDLARNAQGAHTLINEPGMLASLPRGYQPPLLYLPPTEPGGQQPAPFLSSPPCYSLETEVSLRRVGEGEWKEAGKGPELFPSAHLCPPDPQPSMLLSSYY